MSNDQQPEILIFRDKDGKQYYGSQSLAQRLDRIETALKINATLWIVFLGLKFETVLRIIRRFI